MNKGIILIAACIIFAGFTLTGAAQENHTLTKHQAKKWFKKKEWLGGARVEPNNVINKVEFARQYQANKLYWDMAFAFIRDHNLDTISKGRYPIDGTNVFATVTIDPSKDFDKTQWESHRKYIDLQCVIKGTERMGKAALNELTITKPYDEARDVANYSGDGKIYDVKAGSFMIFFPSDAHRPNITPGGNEVVKKIVIKILTAR